MKSLSTLTKKQMRVIDGVGLSTSVVLSVTVFFVGFWPIIRERGDLWARQDAVASQQHQAEQLAASLREQREQLMQIEQHVADHPLRLNPLNHLNRRLSQITALASRVGVKIEQINPGTSLLGVHYVTVPIRVTGRGHYGASSSFLRLMYETLPDMTIAAMNLVGDPRASGGSPSFEFELLWYASLRLRIAHP